MNKVSVNERTIAGLRAKLVKAQDENRELTRRFRVTKTQSDHIDESLEKLGVKDFSSFARGAVFNAIEMGFRAKDPQWESFIEAIQATAKRHFSVGIRMDGALELEEMGKEREGLDAQQLKRYLAKRRKVATKA